MPDPLVSIFLNLLVHFTICPNLIYRRQKAIFLTPVSNKWEFRRMTRLDIGKIRGLQQISTPEGIFIICAMDHRGSLRTMIEREQLDDYVGDLISKLAELGLL